MRRTLSTALLVIVVFGAAACGTTAEEKPVAAATSSAPSPSAPAVATVDRAALCPAINIDIIEVFGQASEVLLAGIDPTATPSPEAVAQAARRGLAALRAFADKHQPTAGDAEIRVALTELQSKVKDAEIAVDAAAHDPAKVKEIYSDANWIEPLNKVFKLCR